MKKYDYIVIVLVIFAAALTFGYHTITGLNNSGSNYVTVTANGQLVKEMVLDASYYETYTYEEDGHENIIISDYGKVYVKSANCHDEVCVKTRAISKYGETIVCLPHKLIVEIKSKDTSQTVEIDSIAE